MIARSSSSSAEASDSPERDRQLHILIVDDNDLVLELVQRILHAAGFSTYATIDPATGIGAAMTQAFDLILLDINMPIISGVDVIDRIKEADGPNRNTPVVAFTAIAESRHEELLGMHDFDAVVPKPINAADLLSTMWRLVGQ